MSGQPAQTDMNNYFAPTQKLAGLLLVADQDTAVTDLFCR